MQSNPSWNTTCADCAGVANGSAVMDECNVCDDDSSNDCTQDCAGLWGGPDNIANTGDEAEDSVFYTDDDGDGFGTGSAISLCNAYTYTGVAANNNDLDDNCFSDSVEQINIDCLGVCDGSAFVDDCGVCDGCHYYKDNTGNSLSLIHI